MPDAAYELLDSLIDQVKKTGRFDPHATGDLSSRQAVDLSQEISKTFTENGFALHIPTDTLSDALYERTLPDPTLRHIFDCDTGSFMFMTIAQEFGADTSLVEIDLSSEASHNYVQWHLSGGQNFNWDTNGQAICSTPTNVLPFQGKPMTKDQALGYVYRLRAMDWEKSNQYDRAIADYRRSILLYPQTYESYNNLAWLLATEEVPHRNDFKKETLDLSFHAVRIMRDSSRLDTLACAYAMNGDMGEAAKTELAVTAMSGKDEFKRRLGYFQSSRDCLGEK